MYDIELFIQTPRSQMSFTASGSTLKERPTSPLETHPYDQHIINGSAL